MSKVLSMSTHEVSKDDLTMAIVVGKPSNNIVYLNIHK